MTAPTPFEARLEKLVRRHAEINDALADPARQGDIAKLAKEYSDLTPLVDSIEALRKARAERSDLAALAGEGEAEMRALAKDELAAIDQHLPELEQKVKLLLLPKDEADERNAILEVRAGTGGEEAALFAADLFRMYQRYATLHGWRFEVMEVSETGLGGFKEAIASITGRDVFARLKFESGVHRVQRVPETEASGRIHTSAATVAVLPEAEEVDVEIKPEDLEITRCRASGLARNRRENQARGTPSVRPSLKSTHIVWSSNRTAVAEMLIPGSQDQVPTLGNDAQNTRKFDRVEAVTFGNRNRWLKPNFGVPAAAFHVNMPRLAG